jgi:Fe-S cluster biogenesis protein NfuA
MDALDSREFQSRLERLDTLLQEAELFSDTHARAHLRETVQAVLDLHKAGLERILGHLDAAGEAGAGVRDTCAGDQVISGLLLLHGLHPLELEARVILALEQVRPYLRSHGGNVELIDLADGVVTLRLEGSCRGCPSSAMTMKQTVEEAILAHAPDALGLVVEGAANEPMMTPDGQALVVLQTL